MQLDNDGHGPTSPNSTCNPYINFEKDPLLAAMLFHENGGHIRFGVSSIVSDFESLVHFVTSLETVGTHGTQSCISNLCSNDAVMTASGRVTHLLERGRRSQSAWQHLHAVKEAMEALKSVILHWNSHSCSISCIHDVASELRKGAVAATEALKSEIGSEILTQQEKEWLTEEFLQAEGKMYQNNAKILTCGSCGIRDVQRGPACMLPYEERSLAQLDLLRYDQVETRELLELIERGSIVVPVSESAEDGTIGQHTRELLLHKLCSYWELPVNVANMVDTESKPIFYHLHPEFVERRVDTQGVSSYWVVLCKDCISSLEKNEVPRFSVAHVDFGLSERLGLPALNCFERQVVSLVRHYHTVIKIERKNGFGDSSSVSRDHLQNAVASHAILFRHDAPIVASANLLRRDLVLSGEFHMQFVGPDCEVDQIMNHMFTGQQKLARWHVIYSWLAVLREINPHYGDIDLPSYDEAKEIIGQWISDMKNTSSRCTASVDRVYNDMVGDDTAKVRETDDHCMSSEHEPLVGIRHSCVTERDLGSKNESEVSMTEVIKASNRALGCKSGPREVLESIRESDPIDEFTNNEEGLTKAFPDVFIFGHGYARDAGALSLRERKHLLLQHSAAAATSPVLLFYLFDQEQRHSTIRGMSCKVKSDRNAFRLFAELLLSDEFQAKLCNALQYRDTGGECLSAEGRLENDQAKRDRLWVLRHIMPVLNFAGKRTLFGAVERNNSVSRILALARRYGPASVFLTVAVDDVNDPLGFRLACRSRDNCSFPSMSDDDFDKALRQGSIHPTTNLCCSYGSRVERAVSNPVAVAMQYRSMIENILTVLVGHPPNLSQTGSKTVKTEYYGSLKNRLRHIELAKSPSTIRPRRGIFGTPVSCCSTWLGCLREFVDLAPCLSSNTKFLARNCDFIVSLPITV